MKIELEYTQEELKDLLDSLNNAFISLQRDYNAILFECYDGIPRAFAPFCDLSLEEMEDLRGTRLQALSTLYKTLLEYEGVDENESKSSLLS